MDLDTCMFCQATGCEVGMATHSIDCPFSTGMWPVDDGMLLRAAACCACHAQFAEGDLYAEVPDPSDLDGKTSYTVCLGCAALAREVAE